MNYQFKYYPDPGITYDIIRMLYVKLNPKSVWKETLTTVDYQEEHIQFIEEHAQLLPDPNSDISIFFFIPLKKRRTFISTIIERLISKRFTDYSISDLYMYLQNIPVIKRDMFSYYLGEQNYKSIDFEYQLRTNRTIPEKIKLLLFGFSYNPEAYTSKVRNIIEEYYNLIKKYWSITSLSPTTLDQLGNCIINDSPKHVDKKLSSEIPTISYSLCRCTPVLLITNTSSRNPFFISTLETINEKISNESTFTNSELLQLVHSVDDQHRLDIIRLLKGEPNLSPNEISEKLGLSITAAKYHLLILKRVGIITLTRNNHKTRYAYNPTGFLKIITALQNYDKGGV